MRLVILLLAALSAGTTRADCDCLWQGGFADVQADADAVLSATVIASKGNSIDLSVDQPMRGIEQGIDIRVWLKAKDYCRPEVDNFPVGSRWVMALHQITEDVPGGFNPHTPSVSYGRIGDYSLSSCGGYWLEQTGDHVTGNLINAARWDHNPKMTPVLVDLIAAYISGDLDRDKLSEASREDPALKDLMLDTRAFLRGEN